MNSARRSEWIRLGGSGARILLCLWIAVGCSHKPATQPVVSNVAAQVYHSVATESLSAGKADPDAAIKALEGLQAKDPDNGFTLYLLAAAYALKGDWDHVTRNLEAGNKATYCTYSQIDALPNRETACYSALRQLAQESAEGAATLEVEKSAALLQGVRGMAKRIAGAEPKTTLNPTIAVLMRATADGALVKRYTQAGDKEKADKARQQETADNAWKVTVSQEIFQLLKADHETRIKTRLGITKQDYDALLHKEPLTPEMRKKMEAMTAEMDAATRPVIEKLLQSMPD